MKKNASKPVRLNADKRRETLLQAAAEVFFEQGFESAKINDIIAKSGGSKRSIYTEFEGKEGLFRAYIKEKADTLVSPLNIKSGASVDLRDSLLHFAEHLLELILAPEGVNIMQCVIAESKRFPELAKMYFTSGPGRATEELINVLEQAQERREIALLDSRVAAEAFMGMLRGNVHLEVLLRLRPCPSKRERKKIAETTVDFFLHGTKLR